MPVRKLLLFLALSFAALSCASRGSHPSDPSLRRELPTRPVIVLPGFAASRLFDPVTRRYVWGTAHSSIQTQYADNLDLPTDPVTHEARKDRLVARGWVGYTSVLNIARDFVLRLEDEGHYATHPADGKPTIYPFYYDWRLSHADNARDLDRLIEKIRKDWKQPDLKVDLMAYSAGTMVAISYLKIGVAPLEQPELWDQSQREAVAKVNSIVMVAAPQLGVTDSVRVLHTGEKFVRRNMTPEILAAYRSLTELLPTDGRVFIDEKGEPRADDIWELETWKKLKLSVYRDDIQASLRKSGRQEEVEETFARSLERGRRFRDAMRRPMPAGLPLSELGGRCEQVTRRVLLRSDGTLAFYEPQLRVEEKHLAAVMFEPGDGSVPTRSATMNRGSDAIVFCEGHQRYARNEEVIRTIASALLPPASASPPSVPLR